MDAGFLEACASLAASLQHFYPLIRTTAILCGLAVTGFSLLYLYRSAGSGRSALPGLAGLVTGAMLASFPAVLDALSMTIFQQSAPRDMASVQTGSLGGLENMVALAMAIVMTVGAYQVLKGLVMLKQSADGAHAFWPAVTHMAGGILCLNIRPFMLALGTTFGGSVQEVVTALLGG